MELWVHNVWHTLITCIAELKSCSREAGTWWNSDCGITNVQGRGRNGLTPLEIFLDHFIWTPLLNSFAKVHGYFFLFFLKKITPCPFWYTYFLEGVYEKPSTLFEMNRHIVEILGWSCGGIVWLKWMAIPGVGDCHTRHCEASKEMSTRRRKTGRWQVPFLKRTHHSTMLKVNQDSLWSSCRNIILWLWMGHVNQQGNHVLIYSENFPY